MKKAVPSGGYLWIPKRIALSPETAGEVLCAHTCPDQRIYRRMTWSERERYKTIKKC